MKLKILFVSLLTSSFLSGCVGMLDVDTNLLANCNVNEDSEQTTSDWDNASVIKLEIENSKFHPSLIQLTRNEPYIISIDNRDNKEHWFTAVDFFSSSKIKKIEIDKDQVFEKCPSSILLKTKSKTSIYLVPRKVGIFDFENEHLFNSTLKFLSVGENNFIFVDR